MLQNADPYGTFAVFLLSQELRNESKRRDKRSRRQENGVDGAPKRAEGVLGVSGGAAGGHRRLQDGVLEGPRPKV